MIKKILKYSIITAIWLAVWQLASMAIGQDLLFPSPLSVAARLCSLAQTVEFYKIIAYSLFRILVGMIIGTFIGILGGILTSISSIARDFFAPLLAVVKSTPVASFIILVVLYVSRDSAPLIIALTMVTPVVWTNVESGILNTDKALLEMASAYEMTRFSKIKHIFVPSVMPFFTASLNSSLSLAWKAGVAAEALILPVVAIGTEIFEAK